MSNNVMWKGKEINTIEDFFAVMRSISTTAEVELFKRELAKGSKYPDAWLFTLIMTGTDLEEAKKLLTLFTGKDCHGDFFIVEGPMDIAGNTGFQECVMRVRLESSPDGLRLIILGPREITDKWKSLASTGRPFMVTDGPERMLQWDEWSQLVGFKRR